MLNTPFDEAIHGDGLIGMQTHRIRIVLFKNQGAGFPFSGKTKLYQNRIGTGASVTWIKRKVLNPELEVLYQAPDFLAPDLELF